MSMNEKFVIKFCSDLDYEEMVADICYKNSRVAMITQENGIDNMEIEIFSPSPETSWTFSLIDFVETIQRARKSLIEMQKFPDE